MLVQSCCLHQNIAVQAAHLNRQKLKRRNLLKLDKKQMAEYKAKKTVSYLLRGANH